ncbi:nudC domain-containing protein 1 [Alosa sapidissima]|uniref:nudC domain-containing protein 1 n=1 Tax=Alosa sapidissima TaxID=34773 RepID=UPI001C080340|nr:nudC domain-containing protein 1 [Alosa sapidissima]
MAYSNYSLKINRELLDPKFESYRLSLDPLPTYTIELDAAVAEVKLKDSQYTLDHVRAFGMYNYLHSDPWYEDSVYFVDCKGRLLNLTVTLDTALGKPREVFRLPSDPVQCPSDPVCASLSLTSATWATLSDGAGTLYLLRTGRRGEGALNRWELFFTESLGEPFTLLHSLSHVQGGLHTLELLLLRLLKEPQDTRGSGYAASLEWVTIASQTTQAEERKYEVKKRRVMTGASVPHYAALEPQGRGVMVAAEKPFRFTEVDSVPVEEPPAEPMETDKTDPVYFWQQTEGDLTVHLRLPEGVTKDAVCFRLTADQLNVGVQGSDPLLKGTLHAPVDPEASTWTLENNKSLEISLQKREEGPMWPELVLGDRRGEHVVTEEQAALIHERLAHLTTDDMNSNPEKDKPPCNAQELEDCDMFPEDSFNLMRFDADTLKPSHVVNLGSHQYLFSVDVSPTDMPCFCLRHDVDALLWQPRPDQPDAMWEHVATFNALGYVQASKRDKKFATCAPDFSFAALGECLRRVFLYRQPSPVDTVLFNRKQGRQVGQVAKQQVASLDTNQPMLGFRASKERLYVLTSNNLFVLKINNQ